MPYSWIDTQAPGPARELHLWPYQSLPSRGYAAFIGGTFLLLLVPLVPLLGSILLWGLLPFLIAALAGLWLALDRSRHNAQVLEVLTLSETDAHLVRHTPKGDVLEWHCNRHWATPRMHDKGGPVPHYVTLRGGGREVEIGAFLSEEERLALYDELVRALRG